jgi:large subunit ribosomal protein L17
MRHLNSGRKFGRETSHRKAMMLNLCKSLIAHGRITTTVPKAKELRAWIEPMVTRAKSDSIHNRRLAFADLRDNGLVAKLYTEIGPKYVGRPGGYTRAFKLGPRQGDAAPMAILEFV